MYISNSNKSITRAPRKTDCPNIISFISDTCRFCPGCDTITEEAYDKYVRYCKDRGIVYGNFNTFARSFRYYAFHGNMINNITLHPVNYTTYNENSGLYVRKNGWAYYNLIIHY